MSDRDTSIQTLKDACRQFVAERQWEQFHSPKNLVMGMAVETAELMEHFLWVEGEASRAVAGDPQKLAEVRDEIADVTAYILCLCNVLELDLSTCLANKLKKNAQKYPVEQYRGRYQLNDRGRSGSGGVES
jgi:NTP pyrophosphatase (non-canonical NTP hydrolase)